MENKLNIQELQNYARQLSGKLCREFFTLEKKHIEGKEIPKFSQIEQLNYFILKILFVKWKDEMAELKKSPYFNYESIEVEKALQDVMNALSNNIVVKATDFQPIVTQSIEETIYLALSPYHYFKIYYFSPEKTKITLLELKEKAKYLKLNQVFFNHFIEKLETYRISSFLVTDIIGYFQESYYSTNDTFDAHEPIIEKFNSLLPLELEKIVTDLKKKDDYAPTPLEVFENQKKINIESAIVEVKSGVENNIKPIKLSLNQKIMFLKELFESDIDKMENTMARLEAAGSLENAKYIVGFFNWNKEKEAVQEFYDLIEAKYK
jgi:hypothetical protein